MTLFISRVGFWNLQSRKLQVLGEQNWKPMNLFLYGISFQDLRIPEIQKACYI